MATGVRIKINSDGLRQALQSEAVQQLLEQSAKRIADEAGDGFEPEVKVMGGSSKMGRAMGYVRTVTPEAKRSQALNHDLQRAVSSARR